MTNAVIQISAWWILALIQWITAFASVFSDFDDGQRFARISLSVGWLAIMLAPAMTYQKLVGNSEDSVKFFLAVFVCVWDFFLVKESGIRGNL